VNPPPALPTLTPPNPVFAVDAVVPLAVVPKSSVPFGVCPITPPIPKSITKAKALRNFKMFNRLLMEVGFLNVFVVLPIVAFVKCII
jgi:hypothetical protein